MLRRTEAEGSRSQMWPKIIANPTRPRERWWPIPALQNPSILLRDEEIKTRGEALLLLSSSGLNRHFSKRMYPLPSFTSPLHRPTAMVDLARSVDSASLESNNCLWDFPRTAHHWHRHKKSRRKAAHELRNTPFLKKKKTSLAITAASPCLTQCQSPGKDLLSNAI